MNAKIKETIQNYTKAIYSLDFDMVIGLLHKEETKTYVADFKSLAKEMDVFGETDSLLQKLKIKNIEGLLKLSDKVFMKKLLKMMSREIDDKILAKMVKDIKLASIDVDDSLATVKYDVPYYSFGKWEKMPSEMTLSEEDGSWKIHFKSGLTYALASFKKEIDLYYTRKSKDKLKNLNHHINDLEIYTLMGYKNMNGDVVFEARFKDAGEFSDGLAYVKVMNKYGFIDKKGNITIKPQYFDAKVFSEKRAGVKASNTKDQLQWGFIDKKGNVVIAPEFDDVGGFNEGLCGVLKDNKWGYIDKKGNLKVPYKYTIAGNFFDGNAFVTYMDKDGEEIEVLINKKGKIVDFD